MRRHDVGRPGTGGLSPPGATTVHDAVSAAPDYSRGCLRQHAESEEAPDVRPGQPSSEQQAHEHASHVHDPVWQHPQQSQAPQPAFRRTPKPTGTMAPSASIDHRIKLFTTSSLREEIEWDGNRRSRAAQRMPGIAQAHAGRRHGREHPGGDVAPAGGRFNSATRRRECGAVVVARPMVEPIGDHSPRSTSRPRRPTTSARPRHRRDRASRRRPGRR